MMKITIPTAVARLLRRLQEAGFLAYAVGGCVRDSILGKMPNDWDICTSARPEQTAALFSHTVLTGARYGTVTVIEDEIAYEITTFRTETGYTDHRHPEQVEFLDALEGDLARRDFTINAMAANLQGNVIDLFDGLHDLRHGLIRCVGQAQERFSEDALRILRALRFASRLNFSIESKTAEAIHLLKDSLATVANERIAKELQLLCGKGAADILREFSDVLTVLIPEIAPCIGFRQYNYHHKFDVFEHSLQALSAEKSGDYILRLTMLLHDIGKPSTFFMDKNLVGHFYGHATVGAFMAERALRRLRFDNTTIQTVKQLIELHDYPMLDMTERSMRRFLGKYGEETFRHLLAVRCADRLGKGTEFDVSQFEEKMLALLDSVKQTQRPLQLKGADLLHLGMQEGVQLGRILKTVQEAVYDGRVENEHDSLVSFAQKIMDAVKND
ncbi:MAG: HD domain-containing protein [Ruminococcaceae bacterium]|nr:HD domain-containing protein [Oscillospiraceae bacterium]